MQVIDLTLTIDNECMTCNTPWHTKVEIARLGYLDQVGRNTSQFRLGSHSATHMDAPLHYIFLKEPPVLMRWICKNVSAL